jgi:hypothetical protein
MQSCTIGKNTRRKLSKIALDMEKMKTDAQLLFGVHA